MSLFSLKGKNILITGASSGIGRACALACAESGANAILMGRNLKNLKELSNEINVNNPENTSPLYFSVDLQSEIDQMETVVKQVVQQIGKIDGMIGAAGIEKTLPLRAVRPTDYQEIFDINVIANFEIARILSKKKFVTESASFVFISSITALISRPGLSGYSASKGALVSGTRAIALELAPKKIRANCISPGTILTPMVNKYLASLSPEEQENRKLGYPLGLGKPKDVAYASIFLLSDASRWITGQNLVIDGGYTIQ